MRSPVFLALILVAAGCSERRNTASRYPSAPQPTAPPPISTNSTEPGLIPAGTTIEVRTNEAIDSSSSAEGRTYPAEVTRDIVGANGNVLVPKGSPAQLVVMNVREGGRVRGEAVELGLQSITVNGRTYMVTSGTRSAGDRGLGANRRTAEMVGGGAVLGTLLGAAAGGGKGAAIGAAVGAAAGAAAQVFTKGDKVRVPAETVMTFRLDQPMRLEGSTGASLP